MGTLARSEEFIMKLLVLLFLVGYAAASASFYDVLDQAADEIVYEFMVGMDSAPSLKRSLGFEDDEESDIAFALAEEDIKTELGKKLRDALDKLLEKVKDTIEQGKTVKGDLIEKLKDLKQKMKDLKVDISEKAKDLLGKIKDKAKDFLKKILDQLDLGGKDEKLAYAEFSIKNIFQKLKKAILGKINKEELKSKIEQLFGKGSELAEQLLNLLREKGEKGKNKILDIIDKILKEDEEEEQFSIERHSIKDMWEKVKNYFKDLNIDLKEKFAKFGEWVKETVKKGLDKTKTKLENIKAIAIEFKKHAKDVSKEIAVEALEFLRPYKEDLGELWDQVKEAVKEVINRKEY